MVLRWKDLCVKLQRSKVNDHAEMEIFDIGLAINTIMKSSKLAGSAVTEQPVTKNGKETNKLKETGKFKDGDGISSSNN